MLTELWLDRSVTRSDWLATAGVGLADSRARASTSRTES